MEWGAVSFDWNQVRAFLATAEEGSFSGAARALGQTQPTLGRQVAALEQALGVTLFERAGRRLLPTPTGLDLLEHVRTMRDAAGRISLIASGQSQEVAGLVRVTASEVMAAHVLPPVWKELRDTAPGIEIDIVASDDLRDLQRREADIAIRHVRPDNPELTARLVGEATARLYASRDYLDRRGRPRTLADLSAHDFVGLGDNPRMLEHLNPLGMGLTLENFQIGSANGIVAWAVALQGLGISVMIDSVGRDAAEMECVLPGMDPITFPVWLTTHRELHTSRRIRVVFDLLADFLSRGLA